MDFDVGSRGKKLAKEQETRRAAARKKLQQEKEWREQAERLRIEMELENQRRKAEQLEREYQEEQQRLEEERVTGGIAYKQTLRAVPIDTDGDKVTLPVSALETLNPQNALDMGVLSFELTFNGIRTHASVLEFVADEGTIGIPPKTAKSLHILHLENVQIAVRFVRLSKGQFVQLQPLGEGFGDRQLDFKALLERTLKMHTTLTQGDILLVRHGGMTFDIGVRQMRPEPQVNILNVDLEVDVLPSEVVESKMLAAKAAEEAQRRAEAQAQREQQLMLERKQEAQARLPDEPSNEQARIKIVLRLPHGNPASRNFSTAGPLQHVLDSVVSSTGLLEHSFQLVANYPRRVFTWDQASLSLAEIGLNGRQEALFIEMVNTPPKEEVIEDEPMEVEEVAESQPQVSIWSDALARWEKKQDDILYNTETQVPIHGLEPVMAPVEGTDKWEPQLQELASMGFKNRELNVQILEKYQGRLLRVVNYLSEMQE
ncbi:hypothetical protein THRCLA_10560 [Thraustotheca clavata]|uniref:UBX domain-containing protein n=1 Tax=Thraustotheca clavata TaxID=74557 RepID=A0A1V9YKH6_9STRA|nr:hypothetical protein THRCLA_10560 [Thraustotheca clavata]